MTNTPAQNPQHRFAFINSKYTSSHFLYFTFCIKITNIHGTLRNYDPIKHNVYILPTNQIIWRQKVSPTNHRPWIYRAHRSPRSRIHSQNKYTIINYINSLKTHHANSHSVIKNTTSSEHSSCFGLSFILKSSSACLLNSSHHHTLLTLISQMDFLPTTIPCKYNFKLSLKNSKHNNHSINMFHFLFWFSPFIHLNKKRQIKIKTYFYEFFKLKLTNCSIYLKQ